MSTAGVDSQAYIEGGLVRANVMVLSLAALACATSPSPGDVYLNVFDCFVEVPSGYAVHTRDVNRSLHLYSRSELLEPHGTILVGNYEVLPAGRFRLLESRTAEGLTVEEIELFDFERAEPFLRIHDQAQQISLIGDATRHADAIIGSCASNRQSRAPAD